MALMGSLKVLYFTAVEANCYFFYAQLYQFFRTASQSPIPFISMLGLAS